MTQHVRAQTRAHTRLRSIALQQLPDSHPGQGVATSRVHEQPRRTSAAAQRLACAAKVLREPDDGLISDWNEPFLASLPLRGQEAAFEIHIGDLEVDRFADAQSGGVQ